ncbi:MAG TPA: hypothetical protein VN229_23550, partial [Terriglobales bacterium]|nr:hypothetical protein [Terriglobales bacterium]
MRRAFFLAGILAPLLCNAASMAAEVAPTEYDSFWLWGGVTPSSEMAPVLAKARTLYILQGEVRMPHQGKIAELRAQGISIPRLRNEAVWLVYRTDTLQWPVRIAALMNARVARWRAAGNQVAG